MRKPKSDRELFFRFKMGIGKRITYSYRIIYWECQTCGHQKEIGYRVRGRIKCTRICDNCGELMIIIMVEKHRVTRS